jgi:hypothetical protein
MQGLALAEEYFYAHGAPMLEKKCSEYEAFIAAGLAGMGSECFGCDDTISRDHDWGPGFCLWLDKAAYERFGATLQRHYDALPKYYKGFYRNTSRWGQARVGVIEIDRFYRAFIGQPAAPESLIDWLTIPESNFAACTNGKVFRDPCGTFSAIRKKLGAYFPEDVRLKKIAGRLMSAGRSGQYNYMRCLRRNAAYEAWWSLIRFCSDILALIYLFNRRFCPYFKWRRQLVGQLPLLGSQVAPLVDQLTLNGDAMRKYAIIENLCDLVVVELNRQFLSDATGGSLIDHGPRVQAHIRDARLREMDVWHVGFEE